MDNIDFAILEALYNEGYYYVDEADLGNMHKGNLKEFRLSLNRLVHQGLILPAPINRAYKITDAGNVAYISEKEKRNNDTRKEKENRSQNIANNITTIVAIVSTIIALLEFILLLSQSA